MRNLLTFARKRHTTRTMVDINQVVRETLALRAYEQRVTNISVIDALASGIPQVFADPHQIQQVLLNLVINAEQAMLTANGRGTLMVRTWQDPDHESIVLELNDDGPGVPEDVRTKIFDPFFTTKEVGKGTGLGLTVAYAIVEEHGGRMWLTSDAGAGASFYVELPVAGGKLKAIAPGELADGAGAAGASGADEIGPLARPVRRSRSPSASSRRLALVAARPAAASPRRRARRLSRPPPARARRALTARPSSSWKTRPPWPRRWPSRSATPGSWWIARATAKRRWRASKAGSTT